MIFRFAIISDEVENFKRGIKIDADNTFLDLFKAIVDCTGFNESEMASFFLCDDNWRKEQEITLVEMDTYSDEDPYTMAECVLNDYLEDEKQKLLFVFDYLTERALFIELSEIITGKSLKKPICTLSVGEAPKQFLNFDEIASTSASLDVDESFFGDESFDLNELDKEGFDGLDDIEISAEESDLY